MKTCLVLEGGAMRGMYTAGALDVFYNAGIKFDGIIGVSAGAAFGVNYLSGQPGRVIRYNKRFNADRHYMGLIPLLKGSWTPLTGTRLTPPASRSGLWSPMWRPAGRSISALNTLWSRWT